MACALCQKQSKLRNSHILPEFFYHELYDLKHRAHIISTDPAIPDRYLQKGLRERLLCEACEQKFSRWEHYAKLAFVDGKTIRITRGQNCTFAKGFDYKKFRLFQLSLLWRMGASSLEAYSEVELGPHQEKLRVALFHENPLKFDQYPCLHFVILFGGQFHKDGILPPIPLKCGAQDCYCVFINGVAFCFFVGNHATPLPALDHCINEKGQMTISYQEAADVPFLKEMIMNFGRAIRRREGDPYPK